MPPAVIGSEIDTVFVSTLDGAVQAIDVQTGEVKWVFNDSPLLQGTPQVRHRRV